MHILTPETAEDFERYFALRWRILRQPWGQPLGSERDTLETQSWHRMACVEERIPVGVARLHLNNPEQAQIRYMAVEHDRQRQGIGVALALELEKVARLLGADEIVLHARDDSIGFYEHLGYRVTAPAHTLYETIRHSEMHKRLR
ncbi:MAG: GNAT family N-acetyltransferase [Gammaproteobacteria bacterium]|nr:GNAT family N-acetyltransferase [Gammaproteobacteria bacterium]